MEYINYTTSDFATDESFQNYFFESDEKDLIFWKEWIALHPEKEKEIKEAIQLLTLLQASKKASVLNKEKELSKLLTDIRLQEEYTPQKIRRIPSISFMLKVAAVFLALLLCLGAYIKLTNLDNYDYYYTRYGETYSLTLPDGSTAVLNGNTKLKCAKSWSHNQTRKVWLDGEAFFTVTHKKNNQKFIVQTSDQINIEVVGTQFNVSKRKSGTRVMLSSGKILLNVRAIKGSSAESKDKRIIPMTPGQMIAFEPNSIRYVKKEVEPALYSSWKDNKLVFKNTSLNDITVLLEETYGVKTIIADQSLRSEKFSGSIPSNNIDVLLDGISTLFDLNIKKDSKVLEFSRK